MVNKNLLHTINGILFVTILVIKSLGDAYIANQINENWDKSKYIILIAALILQGFELTYKYKAGIKIVFEKEMKMYICVTAIFFVISWLQIIFTGKSATEMWVELFYLLIPAVYVYFFLNTIDFDYIEIYMKLILIFSFACYFFVEKGIGKFTISNFFTISYIKSYSPFESSYSAAIAMSCLMFFSYFRKETKWKILSFIFVLLTFKRVALIFSIIFLIIPMIEDVNKKIPKVWTRIFEFTFIFGTFILYYIFQPGNIMKINRVLGINLNEIFMGRADYFSMLVYDGFKSYGFGSSVHFLGINIEMDFVKIFVELGMPGLICFIVMLWKLTKENLYCTIIILYHSINLLTSHSLTSPFGWIIDLIIIGSIHYKGFDKDFIAERSVF